MKYAVLMTRFGDDYKMVVAPRDSYIDSGDMVKIPGEIGIVREVVLVESNVYDEELEEYEARMGYKFPRIESYYDFRKVDWKEEQNGENVQAVEG